jgi:hypothetical protein
LQQNRVLWVYTHSPRKKKRQWPVQFRTLVVLVMLGSMLHPMFVPRNGSMFVLCLSSGVSALWMLLIGIEMVIRKLRQTPEIPGDHTAIP